MTSNIKTEKQVFIDRVTEARSTYETSTAGAKAKLEAALRKVACEMKAEGYNDVEIAEVTGKSKAHIGRMVAAQQAAKAGADPSKVEQALSKSKVTIGEIRKVSGMTKSDAEKRFAKMGLAKDERAKRGGNTNGKRTGDEVVAAMVVDILQRVNDGKADPAETLKVLRDAVARINRVYAKQQAQADMGE